MKLEGINSAFTPNLNAPTKPPSPSSVTIYAPDGSPHVCAPIDAKEILASDAGYTPQPQKAAAVATGGEIVESALADIDALTEKRTEEAESLENLTVAQLKAKAGEAGIDISGLTKKADIIAVLVNGNDRGAE